jgi:hypothetical protein
MQGTELQRPAFRKHIQQVLARNIIAAQQTYDMQAAAEEIHRAPPPEDTYQFTEHHISECRYDWCGRHAGQRRETAELERRERHMRGTEKFHEPPPAPAGPAANCRRCARSGVGVCDDYPNCPAGRASKISSEPDPGWPPQGS